jgi:hypothetical protein
MRRSSALQALQRFVGHVGQPGDAPEDSLQADDVLEHAHAEQREIDAVLGKDRAVSARTNEVPIGGGGRSLLTPETYPTDS